MSLEGKYDKGNKAKNLVEKKEDNGKVKKR
jgi:hypothetical protein